MTRWLTEQELSAWFPLAGVMLRLSTALDSQLIRDSELTHFDYLCLAMLSEEDDHQTTMSWLAARTNSSLSRLSHVISKLEKRGLVRRDRAEHSKRVTIVSLTDQGYGLLEEAAPGHVAHVYDLIFAGLPAADVEALERVMRHILSRIGAAGLPLEGSLPADRIVHPPKTNPQP